MITFPKNRKQQVISLILLVITISWTLFIFNFSTQDAETSSNVSVGLLKTILLYIHDFLWFDVEFTTLHHFFRSLAHFFEFFVLGALSLEYIRTIKIHTVFSCIYCLIIAITDETIQHITGFGRAAQISDIITDFSGSLLAITLFCITEYLIKRIKNKKNKHTTQ